MDRTAFRETAGEEDHRDCVREGDDIHDLAMLMGFDDWSLLNCNLLFFSTGFRSCSLLTGWGHQMDTAALADHPFTMSTCQMKHLVGCLFDISPCQGTT